MHIDTFSPAVNSLKAFCRSEQSWLDLIPLWALVSSAKEVGVVPGDRPSAISRIWIKNRTGPSTVPWGTPDKTGEKWETAPSTTIACCLHARSRMDASQHPTIPVSLHSLILWRRTTLSTLSNTFGMTLKKIHYLVTLIERVGGYLAEITTSWSLRNSDMSLGWVGV